MLPASIRERLLRDVVFAPKPRCWVWIGTAIQAGYGSLRINKKHHLAHRLSYQIHKGKIPAGLCIDHLCRNRRCINPEHLEAVTQRENILRGISPGAIGARASACSHGHPFVPENTSPMRVHGKIVGRRCLACHRKRQLALYHRNRKLALQSHHFTTHGVEHG